MAGKIAKRTPEQKKSDKEKEKKYVLLSVKRLLENNMLENLDHLLALYPASIVAKDINIGYNTMKDRLENPAGFDGEEIRLWAQIIGTDYQKLQDFINKEADVRNTSKYPSK
ncbi:MAG TPA: hypothetical protein VGM30_19055 [Puia sp.]|jgi:hypothetical protein